MLYVILGIVLLLLLTAGIIAYQNSKLITKQKMNGSISRSAMHMYTIFDQSSSSEAERTNAIPLFQFTVSGESNRSMYILCRTAAGKGEMVLDDAQKWILKLIQRAADHGDVIEHKSFIHKTTGHEEKELIMNLEDAVHSSQRMGG